MNDIDKTAKLAQYHSHKNVGMAGYESYIDQQYPELISPKHAIRMDELPLSVRLKHMTVSEIVKLVLKALVKFALGIIVIEGIGIVLFLLQDISRYGLFG
jgi:hypothetical protein